VTQAIELGVQSVAERAAGDRARYREATNGKTTDVCVGCGSRGTVGFWKSVSYGSATGGRLLLVADPAREFTECRASNTTAHRLQLKSIRDPGVRGPLAPLNKIKRLRNGVVTGQA
jgi:hypothetical protein